MRKRVYILGVLFGLLMPFVGVFLGLQISTLLGNIFAFPIIALVFLSGVPFGMWSGWLWFAAVGLSIALWVGIWAVIDWLVQRMQRK